MSLLTEQMVDFVRIDTIKEDDGYGGQRSRYKYCNPFRGVMRYDSQAEYSKGNSLTVNSRYTLTTSRNIALMYHDVIQRMTDKKIFRVTQDGNESSTPHSAGLDMRQVACEEWSLNE